MRRKNCFASNGSEAAEPTRVGRCHRNPGCTEYVVLTGCAAAPPLPRCHAIPLRCLATPLRCRDTPLRRHATSSPLPRHGGGRTGKPCTTSNRDWPAAARTLAALCAQPGVFIDGGRFLRLSQPAGGAAPSFNRQQRISAARGLASIKVNLLPHRRRRRPHGPLPSFGCATPNASLSPPSFPSPRRGDQAGVRCRRAARYRLGGRAGCGWDDDGVGRRAFLFTDC